MLARAFAASLTVLVAACGAAPAEPARAPAPRAETEESSAPATLAEAMEGPRAEEPEAPPPPPPRSSSRGWLGVELQASPPEDPGVIVSGVVPSSPAAKAGLAIGDVIVRIGGEPVTAPRDVVDLIGGRGAGQRVGLHVKRAGAERLFAVVLEGRPERDEVLRRRFVNQKAPSFTAVKTVQGSLTPSIAAMQGKVVVVEFWASWCPVCPVLVPTMNRWYDQYSSQGVEVIGITTDKVPLASSVATELSMKYPVLSDGQGKTTVAYRANALPMLFVIDRQGRIADLMIGYDPAKLIEIERLLKKLVSAP